MLLGAYFVEADEQNDWDISKGGYLHNGKHRNIDIVFGKNNKTGNLECFYYAWNWEQPENPAEKAQFLLVENSLKSSKMAVYVDRIGWGQPDVWVFLTLYWAKNNMLVEIKLISSY